MGKLFGQKCPLLDWQNLATTGSRMRSGGISKNGFFAPKTSLILSLGEPKKVGLNAIKFLPLGRLRRVLALAFGVLTLSALAHDPPLEKPAFHELTPGWDFYSLLGLTEANTHDDIQILGEFWFEDFQSRVDTTDQDRAKMRLRMLGHNGLQDELIRDTYVLQRSRSVGTEFFDSKLLLDSLNELHARLAAGAMPRGRILKGLFPAMDRVEMFVHSQPLESFWAKSESNYAVFTRKEFSVLISQIRKSAALLVLPALSEDFGESMETLFKDYKKWPQGLKAVLVEHPDKSNLLTDALLDFFPARSFQDIKLQSEFFSRLLGFEQSDHFWARLSERILGKAYSDVAILGQLDFFDLIELSEKLVGSRAKFVVLELASERAWSIKDLRRISSLLDRIQNSTNEDPSTKIVGFVRDKDRFPPLDFSEDELKVRLRDLKKKFETQIRKTSAPKIHREDSMDVDFHPGQSRGQCRKALRQTLNAFRKTR